MTSTPDNRYDWNIQRKLWHTSGCAVALVLFHEWKGIQQPFSGADVMLVMGWLAAAGAVAIDIVRFVSPRNRAALEHHPLYGRMLRSEERHHFNASTYMVVACALLVTAWHAGLCRDASVTAAIAVLGVADPAAAAARRLLRGCGPLAAKSLGVVAFALACVAVTWPLCRWMGVPLGLSRMAAAALAVGLLEANAGLGVRLLSPLTRRAQEGVHPGLAAWMRRLYLDDNLLVPLAMAALVEWLRTDPA